MPGKTLEISAAARHDLLSIGRFTERRWGVTQRNLYLRQLDDAFRLLADNALLGEECADILPEYRKFPQGEHIIFYKPKTRGGARIIRVLHKNMDVAARLK